MNIFILKHLIKWRKDIEHAIQKYEKKLENCEDSVKKEVEQTIIEHSNSEEHYQLMMEEVNTKDLIKFLTRKKQLMYEKTIENLKCDLEEIELKLSEELG